MKREGRVSPAPRKSSATTVPRRAAAIRAEILDNARLAVESDPVTLAIESAVRNYWQHAWVAVCLSPSLEVCEALLRGESLPTKRLDPGWMRRFGSSS
jgi:hypothetical protein